MGAMERHVPQVKRKNSTNCSPPDARLTVAGSVACRSGPREVATGRAEGWLTEGWVAASGAGAAGVAVDKATLGGSVRAAEGGVSLAAGAQAARKTTDTKRMGKMRVFIIFL